MLEVLKKKIAFFKQNASSISINLARTKLERSFQRHRKFTGAATQEPEVTACSTPSDNGVFGALSPEHFRGFSPQEPRKFGGQHNLGDRTCKSSIKKRRMLRKIRKS